MYLKGDKCKKIQLPSGSKFNILKLDRMPEEYTISPDSCWEVLYVNGKNYSANYTITYKLNGGTNAGGNPTNYRVYTATITLQNPTRSGYTFGGWYSDSGFKTKVTQIVKGSAGNKTLYAQWKPNKYTIKFSKNGGTSGSVSNLSNREYGKSYALTANAYKRTGYTFAGWNTKKDGSGTKYANKASVKNLVSTNGGSITLYAQWKANKYTIKFSKNGATGGSMSNLTNRQYGKSYALTANAYKRTGYTFAGWNTKKDGSGTKYANKASVKNLVSKNGGSITLYAQWKVNKYTIKFAKNGATSGSMKTLSNREYGKSYKLPLNAYKRKGYTFAGWNTKKDGSGTKYANKASVKNLVSKNGGSITLYARWKANKYTIKFAKNGATSGSMKTLSNREYGKSYKLPLNAYKRKGYTFAGWNTKKDGSGTKYANKASVKNLVSKNGGTITLYAQWKRK